MKFWHTIIFAVFSLMFFTTTVSAVDMVTTLSANQVEVGSRVVLSVKILESQASVEPELPPLPDFKIYSSGHTFSSTIINGRMSASVEYNYSLVPLKVGNFTIGPVKVTIKGKDYTSQPLRLQVVQAQKHQNLPSKPEPKTSRKNQRNDYMVDNDIDRDTVYEGQQVVYTFRAYQRKGASFFSDPVYLAPTYSGFWHEEFGFQRYTKSINGDFYVVNELKSYLFPVSPGEAEIGPTRVVVQPDQFSTLFNNDPFSLRSLRSRNMGLSEPETLFTKPLKIEVKPLPTSNRPDDFKGAVGSFSMKVDISSTDVSVDETILLTVKISGKGNIKTVSAPKLPEISGLDIRASGDTTMVKQAGGYVIGTKVFEFSIIPEAEGVYDLPALRWSYFEPLEGVYKTLKSPKYTLNISPGEGGSDDAFAGMMNLPADIKVRDILGVKDFSGNLKQPSGPLVYSSGFLVLQALPLLALAGVLVWRRRQERLSADVRYRRLKRANSLARKRLSSARSMLKKGEIDSYFGEVSRALYEYIGDKFNLSAAGLTESQVEQILEDNNYGNDLFVQFKELIRSADFGRFAPADSGHDSARELLEKGERWIVMAEQEGKKQK